MTGPSEIEIVALGAFTGLTIYLGMPLARIRGLSDSTRALLSAFAAGILIFIFFDVLQNANGIVRSHVGVSTPDFLGEAGVLLVGFAAGMMTLVVVELGFARRLHARTPTGLPPGAPAPFDPKSLATMVAVGIGLHNFSEGLAIGASYAAGAFALGAVLVIGFAIHNSTEGFGILGPGMMAGTRFSKSRVLALGAVGGAPTVLGTLVGSLLTSDVLSILFFGLAAGAILYVVMQMARPMLGPATRHLAMVGLVVGFSLGYATDLVITLGGA